MAVLGGQIQNSDKKNAFGGAEVRTKRGPKSTGFDLAFIGIRGVLWWPTRIKYAQRRLYGKPNKLD